MGYTGSANLLVRYINSGRVEADHATLSPRRVTRLLNTHPERLDDAQRTLISQLAGACREMKALAAQIRAFADLLTPTDGHDEALTGWIARTRAADLPFLHSFANGLERDRAAVDAAVTRPEHNGRTEGVNNKIKLLKRQTYGRAGHPSSANASCSADTPTGPINTYENLGRPETFTIPMVLKRRWWREVRRSNGWLWERGRCSAGRRGVLVGRCQGRLSCVRWGGRAEGR